MNFSIPLENWFGNGSTPEAPPVPVGYVATNRNRPRSAFSLELPSATRRRNQMIGLGTGASGPSSRGIPSARLNIRTR